MPDLTPEEREKIYQEEKARREAQQRLEQEEQRQAYAIKKEKERGRGIGCLGTSLSIILLMVMLPALVTVWPLLVAIGIGIILYRGFHISKEKTILYSAILFSVLLIGSATLNGISDMHTKAKSEEQEKKAKLEEQQKLVAEAKITPEERIKNATSYINQVKINSKEFQSQSVLIEKAKIELTKIPKTDKNTKVSSLNSRISFLQATLKKKQNEYEKIEARKKKEAERLASINARKEFAKKYESSLLDQNLNVTVTTSGRENTTLQLEFVLVSKVWAHKISQNNDFLENLKNIGFKKFILTDGYDETWYWNL